MALRLPHQTAANYLKCNLDAVIFKEENAFGISLCLRDAQGTFIKAFSEVHQGIPKPEEAEAVALYRAIQWAQQFQIQNIIFETDCKMVSDNIQSRNKGLNDFHYVIVKCRASISSLT